MPPKRRRPPNIEVDSDKHSGNYEDDHDAPDKKRRKCTAVLHVQPIQRRDSNEPHQVIHLTVELDYAPLINQQDPSDIIFHVFHGRNSTATTTIRANSSVVPKGIQQETIPPAHEPHWVWHLTDSEEKEKQGKDEETGRLGDLIITGSPEGGIGDISDFSRNHWEDSDEDDDPWVAEPGPHIDIPQASYIGAGTGCQNRREENRRELISRDRWGRRRQEELIIGVLLGMIVMWVNVLVIVFVFLYDRWWQNMVF
ncbi:hypothetical protein F4809DRAFT_209377 [Biscogniauxia mediterranea]|nr:hypothetical protein F4809DRAFT_209377 [Biscogniauxia mediterranea]